MKMAQIIERGEKASLNYRTPTRQAVDDALAHESLYHYMGQMWRTVETTPFVGGWATDAICEHLEACFHGHIRKLIINIPPRNTKSLTTGVFFPSWCWLRKPQLQFLHASYAQSLSIRDSVKCRRVIQSPRYQELLMEYQPDFVLVGDQNTKIRFENSYHGYRLATSVEGALTGEGGDIIICDDPHNCVEGESEQVRKGVLQWWDEAMSTRLNDQRTGVYIIIMQRLHEEDLTGHVLAKEHKEWDHLCLPAEYEGKNRVVSSIGFLDPRKNEGELLNPERFGPEEMASLKRSLGAYGTAGQLQQRPSPRTGAMIPAENFRMLSTFPRDRIAASIRYWDKAGTEGAGARTAGVLMHKLKDCPTYPEFIIENVKKGQWSAGRREAMLQKTASEDDPEKRFKVRIWIEQEPGSGGKESAENTVRKTLVGYPVYADRVTGDKVTRAGPFAAQVEAGNVGCVIGDWYSDFESECLMFPNGKFKDQVDAASGAFNKLNGGKKRAGSWGRPVQNVVVTNRHVHGGPKVIRGRAMPRPFLMRMVAGRT